MVARLMKENGLCVRPRRGFRCTTTVRDPAHAVAPNALDRDFVASAPNEKWVTDVTFIPTDEGWLCLATMHDPYNREIVGWAMDDTNDQLLTKRALDMAWILMSLRRDYYIIRTEVVRIPLGIIEILWPKTALKLA